MIQSSLTLFLRGSTLLSRMLLSPTHSIPSDITVCFVHKLRSDGSISFMASYQPNGIDFMICTWNLTIFHPLIQVHCPAFPGSSTTSTKYGSFVMLSGTPPLSLNTKLSCFNKLTSKFEISINTNIPFSQLTDISFTTLSLIILLNPYPNSKHGSIITHTIFYKVTNKLSA